MTTLADIRARYSPRERSVPIVMAGGLLEEHRALVEQLQVASAAPQISLAGNPEAVELAARVVDLEQQIAEATVSMRFRGIGGNTFRQLLRDHPATEDGGQFDAATFPPALVAACAVDPKLTEAEAVELAGIVTDGQWDELFAAAWDCCREVDGVPFSKLASALTRD